MNACMVIKCIGNNFVLKLSNICLHFTCRCIAFGFCIRSWMIHSLLVCYMRCLNDLCGVRIKNLNGKKKLVL